MTYGCQIWGQSRSTHVNRISRLQNRAMRIINFETYDANPDRGPPDIDSFRMLLKSSLSIHV